MKRIFAGFLVSALLCSLLPATAAAATLQSGQASYQLSLDPLGTEPFSYSDTEVYSATLVPVGTQIQSDSGALLLVEIFTHSQETGHWVLDTLLSGQDQLTIRDGTLLYHVSTLSPDNTALDRGIWLKAPDQNSCRPISATGEPVDEWALNLVNEAIANNLMPDHLKGQDLREPITRIQFVSLAVRLYETVQGQAIPIPEECPFLDTSDPAVQKAYSMGFTAGVSENTFAPDQLLTREQAAVTLAAVWNALGGAPASAGFSPFADWEQISPWAQDSVALLTQAGIVSGYEDGRFGPQDSAQRQACLLMALRIFQSC